jgi:hypothetical protein
LPTDPQNGSTGLAPAAHGNRRALRHGAYLSKLTPTENAELTALADEIRDLSPVDSPSIEPAVAVLASLIWRQRRMLAFLDERGLVRGRSDRTQLQPAVEAY